MQCSSVEATAGEPQERLTSYKVAPVREGYALMVDSALESKGISML